MTNVVDVDSVLDGVRFRGLPLTVLICSAVVLALDGFDIQVIGFVAPALTTEFGVTRAALGPVLAASLVGMAIGGLGVGPVGDRIGRRAAVLISTAIFALGTLLGSTAPSIETLALWRLLTGIGLGGAMPNVTALMAEYAPPRWRSLTICAAIAGVPVGGMLGAALAAEIIPAFGWRAIFVLGGVLPLIWLIVMYFLLPESPRYLAARGNRPTDLAALLNRVEGHARFKGEETFVLRNTPVDGDAKGVRALFSHALMRDTLAAWVIFGTNIFAVYAIFNWAPVVLTSLGLGLPTAVRGLLLFNLAGVVGSLALSLLIPRRGSRWLLALCAHRRCCSGGLARMARSGGGRKCGRPSRSGPHDRSRACGVYDDRDPGRHVPCHGARVPGPLALDGRGLGNRAGAVGRDSELICWRLVHGAHGRRQRFLCGCRAHAGRDFCRNPAAA